MNFEHYVLTRFNTAHRDGRHLRADWLEKRVELLERFTIPSMEAQSTPARWRVYCDLATPIIFRRHLIGLGKRHGFNVSLIGERFSDRVAGEDVEIDLWCERLEPTHVITTKLDSDDILRTNTLQKIQEQFRGQSCQWIELTEGLELATEDGKFRNSSHHCPCLSAIESYGERGLLTCYRLDYCKADRETVKPWQIKTLPAWCKVFHGDNSIMKELTRPHSVVRPKVDFGVDVSKPHQSALFDAAKHGQETPDDYAT